jgi:hypothetical protein
MMNDIAHQERLAVRMVVLKDDDQNILMLNTNLYDDDMNAYAAVKQLQPVSTVDCLSLHLRIF